MDIGGDNGTKLLTVLINITLCKNKSDMTVLTIKVSYMTFFENLFKSLHVSCTEVHF